jgi:uncharacterized protein with GYD domain
MLHMIVNTHNAESCAFRGADEGRILGDAFDRFSADAGEQGITVEGSWINRGAHEAFILVDAPNANAVEEALLDAGLVGRTHSRVLSVIPTGDVTIEADDSMTAGLAR